MKTKQTGSALGTLVLLLLAVYGAYLAIQYVPIAIESHTVDTILEELEQRQQSDPAESIQQVTNRISSFLNINQMDEMKGNFDVSKSFGNYIIKVSYERELNLLFDRKSLAYEKSATLRP
jgi:uncharacterized membrane protein YdbT with pleckstrin-like domain